MIRASQRILKDFEKKYTFDDFELYVKGDVRALYKNGSFRTIKRHYQNALRLLEFFFNATLLAEKAKENGFYKHLTSKQGVLSECLKCIFKEPHHTVTALNNLIGKDKYFSFKEKCYQWNKEITFNIEDNPKEKLLKIFSDYKAPFFVEKNLPFVKQITALLRKTHIDAEVEQSIAWKNGEFFVALAKISLERVKNEYNKIISANVFIPDDPFVAYDNETGNRSRMERYPNNTEAVHPSNTELINFNNPENKEP